ncbi:O-antigen ligase family protein [Pelagibacterales bacterium SAG-MED39]|nr:O-antigen ligase family protein [Pelagibacterales bacterium SAG-MED39]
MKNKIINNYFLLLFSIIPISIFAGSGFSVSNILLIDISFLIYIIYLKDFSFLKDNSIKYLIIFYLYLIFNSFISIDSDLGLLRNFGFIRVIIFFIALNYFFNQKLFLDKLLFIWLLIFLVVIIDIYYERLNGTNLMGYPKDSTIYFGERVVSFFRDEPIVGGFVNAFYLILIGFLLNKFGPQKSNYILILSIIFLFSILATGERSNTLRASLGILLMFFFYKDFSIKFKVISFLLTVVALFFLISNSLFLQGRFITQFKQALTNDWLYLKIYKSGFKVFENYPFFGVGNKNYRIESCEDPNKNNIENKKKYQCTTHPHQIYLEFLSEHGLLGTLLMFYLLYKLIFSKIKIVLRDSNYLQLGSLIYLTLVFLPLIPSGSFFNDYMLTLFVINLSIFYASSLNLNIFQNNNKTDYKKFND